MQGATTPEQFITLTAACRIPSMAARADIDYSLRFQARSVLFAPDVRYSSVSTTTRGIRFSAPSGYGLRTPRSVSLQSMLLGRCVHTREP